GNYAKARHSVKCNFVTICVLMTAARKLQRFVGMHSKVHFLVRSKVHNVFSGQFQHKRVLKRIAGSTPCSGGCLSTVTSPLGWRQRITLVPAATSTDKR